MTLKNQGDESLRLEIGSDTDREALLGNMDMNLDIIRENTGCTIVQRGDAILITGSGVEEKKLAAETFNELADLVRRGERPDRQRVQYIMELKRGGVSYKENRVSESDTVAFTVKGRPVRPRTLGQKAYVKAMREKDLVFAIGPAGTGKTYIAVAMAVAMLKAKQVEKIVLARPAVEAGENLGFLPGDLQDKVDPYLRPLYDALYDVLGREKTLALKEKEVIEVVPLAYMRGRTLDDAFIILDEAQNATNEQMKMFLTRMGFGSRVVVTGDVTQIDLPNGKMSGLLQAKRVLGGVKGIAFCELTEIDVVRHEMVKKIIRAYDEYENRDRGGHADNSRGRR